MADVVGIKRRNVLEARGGVAVDGFVFNVFAFAQCPPEGAREPSAALLLHALLGAAPHRLLLSAELHSAPQL